MDKNFHKKIIELKSLIEFKGVSSTINKVVQILKEISLDKNGDLLEILNELDSIGFDKDILFSSLEMKKSFLNLEKSIYETLQENSIKNKIDDLMIKKLVYLISKKDTDSLYATMRDFTNAEIEELVGIGNNIIKNEIDRIASELSLFEKIEKTIV